MEFHVEITLPNRGILSEKQSFVSLLNIIIIEIVTRPELEEKYVGNEFVDDG